MQRSLRLMPSLMVMLRAAGGAGGRAGATGISDSQLSRWCCRRQRGGTAAERLVEEMQQTCRAQGRTHAAAGAHRMCCRQQSLQKVWPQSMAVASDGATSHMHTMQETCRWAGGKNWEAEEEG